MNRSLFLLLGFSVLGSSLFPASQSLAEEKKQKTSFLTPLAGGEDWEFQGEYQGEGESGKLGAQVISLGDLKFDVVLYKGGLPGDGWDGKNKTTISGFADKLTAKLSGKEASGKLRKGILTGEYEGKFKLEKILRESPTVGYPAPKGGIVLFDGKNTDAWENGQMEEGLLKVGTRTKQKFRDFTLHIEFRTPFMPYERGQARGNSGVYLLDQYECQVLDSFGLTGENNECGGFYQVAKPAVNMCFPPLMWQTYDIDFTAAKFTDGKKTADAIAHVKHNGVVIHDQLKLPNLTPGGGLMDESQPGSLFLQDHGDPVRFRNIWIVEKK